MVPFWVGSGEKDREKRERREGGRDRVKGGRQDRQKEKQKKKKKDTTGAGCGSVIEYTLNMLEVLSFI